MDFHLKYLFYPNSFTLFAFILLIWGICAYWKDGSERGKYILTTLALILSASVLRQYPLLGRVALYTAPIFILIIAKPLDNKGKKFWLYMVKDYRKDPVFPYILNRIDGQKVICKYQDKNSYLFLIRK